MVAGTISSPYQGLGYTSSVPVEILGYVFKLVHKEKYSLSRPRRPWPEVTLSHVCSTWRELLLSSQNKDFWASFAYDPRAKCEVDRLETYLLRSKDMPVTLYLRILDSAKSWDELDGNRILDLAMGEASRWKSFTLVTADEWDAITKQIAYSKILANQKAEHLESFTALNISNDYDSDGFDEMAEPADTVPQIFTLGAPKLKSVCINDVSGHNLLPPLSNITDLSLEVPGAMHIIFDWEGLVKVIQTPTLERLSVYGEPVSCYDSEWDSGAIPDKIELPSMKELRYDNIRYPNSGEEYSFFTEILPKLSAPKLECLTLGNIRTTDDAPEDAVQKPFPSLGVLILYRSSYQEAGGSFYAWLSEVTSTISTLKIIDGNAELQSFLSNQTLWPDIENFSYFAYSPRRQGFAETFAKFCLARPRLQYIQIHQSLLPADNSVPGLEKLKDHCKIEAFSKLSETFMEAIVFKLPVFEPIGWDDEDDEGERDEEEDGEFEGRSL